MVINLSNTPPHFYLGLDLGQRRDHSALVILERTLLDTGEYDHAWLHPVLKPVLHLRYAERIPLGQAYLGIPPRLADIVHQLDSKFPWPARQGGVLRPHKTLVVDAGGPGAPIVEILHRARLGVTLFPVLITPGHHAHSVPGGFTCVPRRVLLSTLRILFENRSLRLSGRVPSCHALIEELATVQIEGRQPNHDDLAIATALAAWRAAQALPALLSEAHPSCS
jgi:hypothetical protein